MTKSEDVKIIQGIIEEFFLRMTIDANVDVKLPSINIEDDILKKEKVVSEDIVIVEIKTSEPQILIGEGGQTLFELQKILRSIVSKKTENLVRLDIDINDYRKKKAEYLKALARDLADEVFLTKQAKTLSPMSSYERRIIHMELASRPDIVTESEGEGEDRRVIIKPK